MPTVTKMVKSWDSDSGRLLLQYDVTCAVMEVAEAAVEGQWFSIGRIVELGLVGGTWDDRPGPHGAISCFWFP